MSLVCAVQCDRCQTTVLGPNVARLNNRKNARLLRADLKARGWQVGGTTAVNEADRCAKCVETYGPIPGTPEKAPIPDLDDFPGLVADSQTDE